jgi:hypothetical protein
VDNFFFKLILSCQQFDNCSHCLPSVSFTLVANLPPLPTTQAKLVEKFAAGVVDTGGKFAVGVVHNVPVPVPNRSVMNS